MLRYAMRSSVSAMKHLSFIVFLYANNFHRGLMLIADFPFFLRRVTNQAHRFVITCLKLAIKIVDVSRICCFFNRTQYMDVTFNSGNEKGTDTTIDTFCNLSTKECKCQKCVTLL